MRTLFPFKPLLAATAVLALTACATTPNAFAPAARAGEYGYADTRIEQDRYRVSFRTNTGSSARANDLALLRAAELTLQSGYDWFIVTQRGIEAAPDGSSAPRVSVGVGGANYGGRSSVGLGAGVGFNIGGAGQGGSASATLEVRMGKGAKPTDAQAYDAREVERSIRPRA